MHDVACEFARAAVRSKDAQKQLARTSLMRKTIAVHVRFKTLYISLPSSANQDRKMILVLIDLYVLF